MIRFVCFANPESAIGYGGPENELLIISLVCFVQGTPTLLRVLTASF